MDNRLRILDAAKHVYAQHGFRGATTRLIAIQAGVNEVTLFRTFGSKAALFDALLETQNSQSPVPELPEEPRDPAAEMTAWCAAVLRHLRENRSLIRTAFGEMEERPEAAASMCQGPNCAGAILGAYVARLHERGLLDQTADIDDADVAVSMLMSSLIGDAISRDVMPDVFPEPEEKAPAKYVRVFLRAIGLKSLKTPRRRASSSTRSASGR